MAPARKDRVGPALAMLDISEVPRGIAALDALVKEAPVTVVSSGTIPSGRYLILFGGGVEAVELAWNKARAVAGSSILDGVMLPYAEERILPAIGAKRPKAPSKGDTLGVLQAGSAPTIVRAVDHALKGAFVELLELRVATGLTGKATAMLWGETHDMEAAIEHARDAGKLGRGDSVSWSIVRNADSEVVRSLDGGTAFFKGGWGE